MNVTQLDSRTIRVVTDSGVSFFLPYRFSWNGHDREPASVVLETTGSGSRTSADVKAFFLFGLVKDRITADAGGVVISRSWNVMTPGPVKVLLDLEFDAQNDPVCFFPGVHVERGLPASPVSFLGERTSYPAALIVTLGDSAAAIFSRSARSGQDAASIGVSRTERDDEPVRLHVEVRFPGVEQPVSRTGPRPEHRAQPEDPVIECSGSLERTHELFLAFSPRREILLTAPAAVLKRLPAGPVPKRASKSSPALAAFRRAAEGVLSSHLVEEGGVAGLREVPGSPWLSSTAGVGLAVALRRLFPREERMGETALRLADFSLKGQLPSGLFYESFHRGDGKWHGVRGQQPRPVLSVPHSARIADLLLMLAEDLEGEGLPFEKYFLAGQRFVDLFVDDRGRCAVPASLCSPAEAPTFGNWDARLRRGAQEAGDIRGWEIFFPLCRVLDRLGKDRYKKAQGVIAERFAGVPWDAFHPPTSRPGRDADSEASRLVVRLFVELRRRGYRPAEPKAGGASATARSAESARLFASLILPWIRVHRDAERAPGEPPLDGTVVDSFARQRLLFAGNETAYLLKRLAELAGRRDLKSLLEELSRICLAGGRDLPPGTAFFRHTSWDPEGKVQTGIHAAGPVDSRRLASELLYGLLAANRPDRPAAGGPSTGRRVTSRTVTRPPVTTPPSAAKPSARSGRGARSRKPSGKP